MISLLTARKHNPNNMADCDTGAAHRGEKDQSKAPNNEKDAQMTERDATIQEVDATIQEIDSAIQTLVDLRDDESFTKSNDV